MPMVPFYSRFRELAFAEMRSVTTRGYSSLPDADYGFLEFYCNEPACDCRRVLLQVIREGTGTRVWASINFGWETPSFYHRWSPGDPEGAQNSGSYLDPLNPQTEHSKALLDLFRNTLQTDIEYVRRLERHYQLAKATDAMPEGTPR